MAHEGRLLAFALAILLAHVVLRREAIALMGLFIAGVGLGADLLVRMLIAFDWSGIAVNGPDVEMGLQGRSPGASYEWTGQAGFPREFRTSGRWNRWSLNDRDPPFGSADPVVLVLGDSYVEGLQVPGDAVFFRVAEERLGAGGHVARMVGVGESGSGACGAAAHLEEFGDSLQPAAVVYAFVYNDVRNDYAPWTEDAAAIEGAMPGFLSARYATRVPSLDLLRFHVRQGARTWLAAHRSRQGISPDALMFAADAVADVSPAWAATLGCVDRMDRWARARASAFAVLELPPGSPRYAARVCRELQARGNACDPELPRRRLGEQARATHHAFLTPIDDFRKAWQADEDLQFRWDGHYNSVGHRLVGRYLADHLPPLLAAAGPRGRERPASSPWR